MALAVFQLLLISLLLTTIRASAVYPMMASLGTLRRHLAGKQSSTRDSLPPEFETRNYTQTLDHFNYRPESYATFQQRYIVNSAYWGGSNSSSPVFVYLGGESDLTYQVYSTIIDHAARFKALLLYIEHRYYGVSTPFVSQDQAYLNSSTLGYLSSEQALADFAQLITDFKKNLSAENCPVVAFGGSYGGMLASWFRLKYPHIVIGALASSAPILYFDNITPQSAYHAVVTRDFRESSESCYNTIKQSWSEIDRVAAEANGLATLGNIFSTCRPLNSTDELKSTIAITYVAAAQMDNPPNHLVDYICNAIDGAPVGSDVLGRIAAGFNVTIFGNHSCHQIINHKQGGVSFFGPWGWQTCTEIVTPIGYGENETMFQANPFDLDKYMKDCVDAFGITPRPHWITTEFGGHDIKAVLRHFASNIIFSNGGRDPWSAGGVLEDISDSIVSIVADEGSHCVDLYPPSPDDPDWLVAIREKESAIIESWITE